MKAPTADELLNNPVVRQALDEAWLASLPDDRARRHEEGGWIYVDTTTGVFSFRRAKPGSQAVLDVSTPPIIPGAVVVATYHTHPNPVAEGWDPTPSPADTRSAWLFGVPCLVRAEDGVRVTGPDSRRGGLSGDPGFPS